MGRSDQALAALARSGGSRHPLIDGLRASLRALIGGQRHESLEATERTLALRFHDPEALYYLVRQLAYLGAPERALAEFPRVIDEGYTSFPVFARDPWLDSLRAAPEFVAALARAEAAHREAVADFTAAEGDRLLGVRAAV